MWSLNVTLVPDYQALFAFFNGDFYQHTNTGLSTAPPASGALPSGEGQSSLDQVASGLSVTGGGVEDVLSNINMRAYNAIRGG